jgi:hypothetical protein
LRGGRDGHTASGQKHALAGKDLGGGDGAVSGTQLLFIKNRRGGDGGVCGGLTMMGPRVVRGTEVRPGVGTGDGLGCALRCELFPLLPLATVCGCEALVALFVGR